LGIRHVGEETAIDLAQYFSKDRLTGWEILNKIKNASKEELKNIPNIGIKVADSIFKWFNFKNNKRFLEDLKNFGIKISTPEKTKQKLNDKIFVLTGSLERMTRDEAKKEIRMIGGSSSESVSQKTDYLVAGKNPGSKLGQAKKLGVKIITEEDFLRIIK
jgi:DNA ligase (NAD+)